MYDSSQIDIIICNVFRLFVTTASIETLNGTMLGVTLFLSSPPGPKRKVTPKVVPFGKQQFTMKVHYINKVNIPRSCHALDRTPARRLPRVG